MYALILNVVVAFAVVAYTANSEKWFSKRPSINLKTIPCDRIEQSDLCRCCPINPCDGITCMNGGECVGDGVCQCVSGYHGPTCDVSPCDGVICMNGGECVGEGVCNCSFGFGGPTCNMRVCNVTECVDTCTLFRCSTDGGCGGTQCDATDDKVCIDDNCVIKSENCGVTINGMANHCADRGVPCGGGFCLGGHDIICVNNTCRFVSSCTGKSDDTACDFFGIGGTCSGGACLEPCRNDSVCFGNPCIGGFCAGAKCGEQLCLGLGG